MGKVTNFAHFLYVKINFSAKSQQKNYSTENKVIGTIFICSTPNTSSQQLISASSKNYPDLSHRIWFHSKNIVAYSLVKECVIKISVRNDNSCRVRFTANIRSAVPSMNRLYFPHSIIKINLQICSRHFSNLFPQLISQKHSDYVYDSTHLSTFQQKHFTISYAQ